MESITIGQVFKGAWRDGIEALLEKPIFTLVIFALFLVATNLRMSAHASVVAFASTDHLAHAQQSLLLSIASLLRAGAMICLTIHVMRFCVMGDDPARAHWLSDGTAWRYFRLNARLGLLIVAMVLPVVACVAISAVLVKRIGITLTTLQIKVLVAIIICAAVVLVVFVTIRLSLLFCHTALGGRPKMRDSWNDTRGRVLSIAGAHFVTALPLLLVVIIAAVAAGSALKSQANDAGSAFYIALMQTLWLLIGIAIGGACSAWQYRRYAMSILDS